MDRGCRGRDRRHERRARERALFLRYSHAEFAAVAEAARLAELTPSGYAAEAALAAARGLDSTSVAPFRAALAELMIARMQLRRYGTNVNQAIRELNSTGQAPEWLERAAALATAAVERVDAAACHLGRRAR